MLYEQEAGQAEFHTRNEGVNDNGTTFYLAQCALNPQPSTLYHLVDPETFYPIHDLVR